MTKLRNTVIRSRKDSTTTRPMKSGSLALSTLEKSMKMAVVPPTSSLTPEWPTTWGMVSPRRWLTRSVVARVLGRRIRIDVEQHDVATAGLARDVDGLGHPGHVGLLRDVVRDGVDHGALVGLHHADQHRAVR